MQPRLSLYCYHYSRLLFSRRPATKISSRSSQPSQSESSRAADVAEAYAIYEQHAVHGLAGAVACATQPASHPAAAAAAVAGGGEGAGDGTDRLRRLDGGRRQQQRGADGGEEQLRAVRARLPGPPRHRPLLQRPPCHRLLLRGVRPPSIRPGLPRPGLRHPGLRLRRLLCVRRLRPRRRYRRRLFSDPLVEASGLLQGVQAAAGRAPGRSGGGGGGGGRRVRHQRGHQRLHRELLRVHDGEVPRVQRGRVHRLPGGPGTEPAGGAVRSRRTQGRLHGARRGGVPPAGARPPHDALRRGVQRRGARLQRGAPRHGRRARRRPPRRAPPLRRRLRLLRRHSRRPGTIRVRDGGGGVLRDGAVRGGVHVQRVGRADVHGRGQVRVLGRRAPDRAGQPDRRGVPLQHHLRPLPLIEAGIIHRSICCEF